MPVLGLNHINVRAPGEAFTALRRFYCDVLGLRPGERPALDSRGLWLYAGDAAVVHLVEAADGSAAAPGGHDTGAAPDHVAFTCSGLEDLLGRLESAAVPISVRLQTVTRQVLVRLRDPCGSRLELVFAADEAALGCLRRRGGLPAGG